MIAVRMNKGNPEGGPNVKKMSASWRTFLVRRQTVWGKIAVGMNESNPEGVIL